jgi:hypothetical protein
VPTAVWVVMTILIAVTAVVASLGLVPDYRQKKLGIESAAGLIIADALHPVSGAEQCSARRADPWASFPLWLPWGRSGRQISVTPSADAADPRAGCHLAQNRARDDVTHGSLR